MAGSTLDADTAKDRLRSEFGRAKRTLSYVLKDNAAKVGFVTLVGFVFLSVRR